MFAYLFISLSLVFLLLFFLSQKKVAQPVEDPKKAQPQQQKVNYGHLAIYYASQTGTAAKLSENLAEEAAEQGFDPQVVDLKVVSVDHFSKVNDFSIFLLSNTGEGQVPDNAKKFFQVLKGKGQLDEVKEVNWKMVSYTVFALGNTQYEHYNKVGKDADRLLEKLGANRIYKLGLGDDNASLEDDFIDWKKKLWIAAKAFRKQHPMEEVTEVVQVERKKSEDIVNEKASYLSKVQPTVANFKIYFDEDAKSPTNLSPEELDFKTKASLKSLPSQVKSIKQLRQNQEDGSTLELEIEIEGQPQFQTAGNVALYPQNDPQVVQHIYKYFNIEEKQLDIPFQIQKIYEDKKFKLNFIPHTLRRLVEEQIDVQGRITKSILKKLSKLKSKNADYFIENSGKTTDQFKRITQNPDQNNWYYLFRLIQEFEVEICFEDFIELSDSIAPRLFTMASYYQSKKNVFIAASLVESGLISKHFLRKPQAIRAELRKSTFTDMKQWKKVIFISAGTGVAPFIAYVQEKEYLLSKSKKELPIITFIFGCKHENGDFIYKEQIMQWKHKGVIDKLHLAFSRDQNKKVYVQNVLEQQEEQLKELGHCEQTAIFICGSLAMGQSIINVLTKTFGAEKVKQMEENGRIVKQLW